MLHGEEGGAWLSWWRGDWGSVVLEAASVWRCICVWWRWGYRELRIHLTDPSTAVVSYCHRCWAGWSHFMSDCPLGHFHGNRLLRLQCRGGWGRWAELLFIRQQFQQAFLFSLKWHIWFLFKWRGWVHGFYTKRAIISTGSVKIISCQSIINGNESVMKFMSLWNKIDPSFTDCRVSCDMECDSSQSSEGNHTWLKLFHP